MQVHDTAKINAAYCFSSSSLCYIVQYNSVKYLIERMAIINYTIKFNT